jgi:Eukaryotic porin
MKLFAIHAQVMSNNVKDRVIMGQADVIARVTKQVYGGAKIVYDDKAHSLEMTRYGAFWKAQKNFLLGLEYNQTGDLQALEATINHKVNLDTSVGSTIVYDLSKKRLSNQNVIESRIDPSTTIKAKIDNLGLFDLSVTG